MSGNIPQPTIANRRKITLTPCQLPEMYNKLLKGYVVLLKSGPANPYEFSIKQRVLENFNFKEQLEYAKSPQINDFLKTPNALAQELPAAKEMLRRLDHFDDQAIKVFTRLNTMNLNRLRRRSIRTQIVSGIAFTISLLGLILNLQNILAFSIKDTIAWMSRFNLSPFFQVGMILFILFVGLIAFTNWMITTPRIGLIDAFGDILAILMVHRNLKE